ncbi:hypothetical protein SAMN05216559_1979 [Halomicrobium zhouii]|uniref:Uncharacterized protein n=1 Tax=Halomicrobium zhouii TaxID=767519 RepID=A0A1I6L3X2_9EURY|nr:hypothetical protein [Halomicrobium zhouii]SFR98139.1 hypothetical protein SAMN05216559_1979 [Halomicrobium zhouii]
MEYQDLEDDGNPYIRIPFDKEALDGNPEIVGFPPSETVCEVEEMYVVARHTTSIDQVSTIHLNEIAEITDVDTKSDLDNNLYKYKARGQNFIPLISEKEYFDVENDQYHALPEEMVVSAHTELLKGLSLLIDYPFLISDDLGDLTFEVYDKEEIDFEPEELARSEHEEDHEISYKSPYALRQEYPEAADDLLSTYPNRFGLVTISDINKKRTKDALFPYFALFAGELAELIKEEYPKSANLASAITGIAVKNWRENKGTETEVHISEFLGLSDMADIISNSNRLLSATGFQLEEEFRETMDNIREFRNRVMHANKTLVHNRDELTQLVESLNEIQGIIDSLADS